MSTSARFLPFVAAMAYLFLVLGLSLSGALTLGMPDSPGVPADLAKHTLNLPYNDLAAVRRLPSFPGQRLSPEHRRELQGVLRQQFLEPETRIIRDRRNDLAYVHAVAAMQGRYDARTS